MSLLDYVNDLKRSSIFEGKYKKIIIFSQLLKIVVSILLINGIIRLLHQNKDNFQFMILRKQKLKCFHKNGLV